MADDDKEESSIRTPRKHNFIPGIDNDLLVMGASATALGVAVLTWLTSEQGKTLLQKVLTPPPGQQHNQQLPSSASQIVPPPPEPEPIVNEPVPESNNNEVTDASPRLNISPPPSTNSQELEEVDHKNFQTQRRKQGPTPSPFGASIARG